MKEPGAALKKGSRGAEVEALQFALQRAGFGPSGTADGLFGPGTEVALKAFQRAAGLPADGIAGPKTLAALEGWRPPGAPATPPPPCSLLYRCLSLTAAIETGHPPPGCFAGVSGNFDGQGMSFGALQWNFGQGTLQPLLLGLFQSNPSLMHSLWEDDTFRFHSLLKGSRGELVRFFAAMQAKDKGEIWNTWKGRFRALGTTPECIASQEKGAEEMFRKARASCRDYGLSSERAVALLFDIHVQNGGIAEATKARILTDFLAAASEEEKLVAVANRRAEAANPRWIEDVRARKLTIARGRGMIHGRTYDLATQFGISLERADGQPGNAA